MKKNIKPISQEALAHESLADGRLPDEKLHGEKLQKVLAQAGFGSRRMMEEWIANGQVIVNGETATLGMRVVEGDLVKAERRTIRVGERDHAARVLLYHKPEGEIVSRDDPGKLSLIHI